MQTAFHLFSDMKLLNTLNITATVKDLNQTNCHTPHPGPLPVEGRGEPDDAPHLGHSSPHSLPCTCQRNGLTAENVFRIRGSAERGSLSPQRGEGRGEGCERSSGAKWFCRVNSY